MKIKCGWQNLINYSLRKEQTHTLSITSRLQRTDNIIISHKTKNIGIFLRISDFSHKNVNNLPKNHKQNELQDKTSTREPILFGPTKLPCEAWQNPSQSWAQRHHLLVTTRKIVEGTPAKAIRKRGTSSVLSTLQLQLFHPPSKWLGLSSHSDWPGL